MLYEKTPVYVLEDWLLDTSVEIKTVKTYNISGVTGRFNTKRNNISAQEHYSKICDKAKINLKNKMELLKNNVAAETTYFALCDVEKNVTKDETEDLTELQLQYTIDCSQNSYMMEKMYSSISPSFTIPPDTLCDRAESAIQFLNLEQNGELFQHLEKFISLNEPMEYSTPSTSIMSDIQVTNTSDNSIFGKLENTSHGLLYTKLLFDENVSSDKMEIVLTADNSDTQLTS